MGVGDEDGAPTGVGGIGDGDGDGPTLPDIGGGNACSGGRSGGGGGGGRRGRGRGGGRANGDARGADGAGVKAGRVAKSYTASGVAGRKRRAAAPPASKTHPSPAILIYSDDSGSDDSGSDNNDHGDKYAHTYVHKQKGGNDGHDGANDSRDSVHTAANDHSDRIDFDFPSSSPNSDINDDDSDNPFYAIVRKPSGGDGGGGDGPGPLFHAAAATPGWAFPSGPHPSPTHNYVSLSSPPRNPIDAESVAGTMTTTMKRKREISPHDDDAGVFDGRRTYIQGCGWGFKNAPSHSGGKSGRGNKNKCVVMSEEKACYA